MRPSQAHSLSYEEPQLSSTTTPTCNSHTCRWRPYSDTNDFEANAAMLVIVLFSALISALSLNAAIRCCLLRTPQQQEPDDDDDDDDVEASASTKDEAPAPTVVVFSSAGAEAECTICLSEFDEGESIRVLERCDHGFHVKCIEQWLSTHSSCPICRTSILHESSHQSSPSDSHLETC